MTNKFVVDTNVVISAVLVPYSIPAQALRQARRVGIILQSQATLDELDRVLHRKKFDKYVSEIDRLEFLAKFATKAQLVEIRHTITICRDPRDNKFLELALSGDATLIMSGDLDLLTLSPFQNINIITPSQFLADYPT